MPLYAPGIPRSEVGAANGVAPLDGTGKVPLADLPINSRTFKGAWNATTNTPTLANGVGDAGDEYICTVAGSHNFGAGAIAFVVGDAVAYNGTIWQKVAAEYPVTEVNGHVGAVDLTAADVGALSAAGGSSAVTLSYASTVPNSTLMLHSNNPELDFSYLPGAADAKKWNFIAAANSFTLRALHDDGSSPSNVYFVGRAAGVANLFALEVPSLVLVPANGNKLWLAKYNSGTGHSNAPTAFDATANYLQVGGREYGNNGFSGIGFGYVSVSTDNPCVMIGHEEKNPAGNTAGDFIIATRNVTTNTAPTIQFRITAAGQTQLTSAGTLTAPSLAFATSTNTGLFLPAAGEVALVANGIERLRGNGLGVSLTGHLLPAVPNTSKLGQLNAEFSEVWAQAMIQAPSVLSSNGTFTDADPDETFLDATANNLSLQINMGATSSGKRFLFKKIDASTHTVTITLSAGTIDGAADIVLSTRWQWIEFRVINATTAYVIGKG